MLMMSFNQESSTDKVRVRVCLSVGGCARVCGVFVTCLFFVCKKSNYVSS